MTKLYETKRFQILIILMVILSGVLAIRLFQKQIIQNSHYRALAEKQYLTEKELPQERGEIFISDKYDEPYMVAVNIKYFDLLVVPKNIKNPKEMASKLANLIGMTEKEIFDLINNDKPYIPPIKKKIEVEVAKKIQDLKITGVLLIPDSGRYYPEKNLASQVLGFVDAEKQGRYGVEGYYNQILSGKSEKVFSPKMTLGNFLGISENWQTSKGSDLYLSIDRNIQFVVEQKLQQAIDDQGAESGTIIVSDPLSGKILAMASKPDYDPNKFNDQSTFDIFINPAIAHSYEPGSIFKIFSMAGAIDAEKVTPETEGIFGSQVKVGIETIKTSTGQAYGRENMTEILQHSDNVGMVWVAQKLGIEAFEKYIRSFGFGQKTGIDLESEAITEMLPLKQWREINLATISFGQGIAVTPIQLVAALGAMANKGKVLQPTVLDKIKEPNGKEIKIEPKEISRPISEKTAKTITEMMTLVVDKGFGKKAKVEGYKVAGKTGTAQIPDPQKRGYLENEKNCSFFGFGPADSPKFLILVKINKPKKYKWAEDSTAPVFKEIAQWLFNYLQIPPQQ